MQSYKKEMKLSQKTWEKMSEMRGKNIFFSSDPFLPYSFVAIVAKMISA